jgi:hypothetical protein
VEEALSTDYSSHFDEEDSTLRDEKSTTRSSTHTEQRRRAEQRRHHLPPSPRLQNDKKDRASSNSSLDVTTSTPHSGSHEESEESETGGRSRKELVKTTASSPDIDDTSSSSSSNSLFTLEMIKQKLSDAALRDRVKLALIKQQERELLAAARQELAHIEDQLGGDDLTEKDKQTLRRRQQSVRARLKEQLKGTGRRREAIQMAERERQPLEDQLQSLMLKIQRRRSARKKKPAAEDQSKERKDEEAENQREFMVGHANRSVEPAAAGPSRQQAEFVTGGWDETDADAVAKAPLGSVSEEVVNKASAATSTTPVPALLPLSPQRLGVLRIRHPSSGESEAELSRDYHHPTGDASTTASDQSDVEARFSALSEQHRSRMRTAARLKKEQLRGGRNREQLRGQEAALLKQIEVYDQLISEGASVTAEKSARGSLSPTALLTAPFSKPKIKSPKSSLAAGLFTASPRRTDSASRSSDLTSADQSLSQALGGEPFLNCIYETSIFSFIIILKYLITDLYALFRGKFRFEPKVRESEHLHNCCQSNQRQA